MLPFGELPTAEKGWLQVMKATELLTIEAAVTDYNRITSLSPSTHWFHQVIRQNVSWTNCLRPPKITLLKFKNDRTS